MTSPPGHRKGGCVADIDPIYVAARRVLLDALQALHLHSESIVLIGAQAVYVRTERTELAIAPFTTDADIALNPTSLGSTPEISQIMEEAHFSPGPHGNPGEWVAQSEAGGRIIDIPVDLLVPESLAANKGRRSARLEGHAKMTARAVPGIEAVVVDNNWMVLNSLDPSDVRQLSCRVAGPAGLLIAKAYKIRDRLEPGTRIDRQKDKDALDIYRLALAIPFNQLASAFSTLLIDDRSEITTREGLDLLSQLFGTRRAPGIEMATRALEGTAPASRIEEVLIEANRSESAQGFTAM
jgi:hypothetical protein